MFRKLVLSLALLATVAHVPADAQRRDRGPDRERGYDRRDDDRRGRRDRDDDDDRDRYWRAPDRGRDRDQDIARRGVREGRYLPRSQIVGRVRSQMRGYDFLGEEMVGGADRYRLKFMRGGQVIWVDVDARTGAIVGRSGR